MKLLTEKRRLSSYIWRGLNEGHHFCPTCSTPIMRSGYPNNKISINARCIDGIDVFTLEIERYDGRNDMFPGPLP